MVSKQRFSGIVVLASCILLAAPEAKAQIPAIDATAIANVVARVQNLVSQFQQFKDMASQLEQAKSAIGDAVNSAAGELQNAVKSASSINFDSMKPKLPGKLSDLGLSQEDLTDKDKVKDFVSTKIMISEEDQATAKAEDIRERAEAKMEMIRQASSNLYAQALSARSDASKVDDQIKAISDASSSATTERDDLGAVTMANTQMIRMLASMNASLASSLETLAVTSMSGM